MGTLRCWVGNHRYVKVIDQTEMLGYKFMVVTDWHWACSRHGCQWKGKQQGRGTWTVAQLRPVK